MAPSPRPRLPAPTAARAVTRGTYRFRFAKCSQIRIQRASATIRHHQTNDVIGRIHHDAVHHQDVSMRMLQEQFQQLSLIVDGGGVHTIDAIGLHCDLHMTAVPPRQAHLTKRARSKHATLFQSRHRDPGERRSSRALQSQSAGMVIYRPTSCHASSVETTNNVQLTTPENGALAGKDKNHCYDASQSNRRQQSRSGASTYKG